MREQFLLSMLAGLLVASCACGEEFRYEPNWNQIRSHYKCPEWFRDAKFGIFLHWGPYAVPAYMSEKYPKGIYAKGFKKGGMNAYSYHREKYGEPSTFGYKDFIPLFKAEKFDAREWAALFKQAGARYVVPVAEHHDGFAMYASQHTRWNVADMGPKKDTMRLLADACRTQGMKFGASSHFALNRVYYYRKDPSWDTNDPRFYDLYGRPVEKDSLPDQEFLDHWWDRTTDIIDQYEPDVMWFDFGLDKPGFESVHKKVLAYYYNKGLEWQKGVVFQDKNMKYHRFPEDLIVLDIERGRMTDIHPRPWQTDTSIGKISWGYIDNEEYKTSDYLLDELIDIVSKNGCLLLNIGPKADGTIPDEAKAILKDMGAWLKVNGEAIYGTRPWKTHGEGPTKVSAGHHSEKENADNVAADIRFTSKGDTLYATSLAWPEDGIFRIKSLAKGHPHESRPIASVWFVGGRGGIDWKQTDEELQIKVKGKTSREEAAYVFAFRFDDGKKSLIDYFLPMQPQGPLVSEGIWGERNVLPRDVKNGLESEDWCYWDGRLVEDDDGKVHFFGCRWDQKFSHADGWKRHSKAIHAVADSVMGPYEDKGEMWPHWQQGEGCNVIGLRMHDGRWAAVTSETTEGEVFAADSPGGPWQLLGKIKVDLNGFDEGLARYTNPAQPSFGHMSNVKILLRPDGRYMLIGRSTAPMISEDGILGPYKIVNDRIYRPYPELPQTRNEDPTIWYSGGLYHIVYNHWPSKTSHHFTSEDGLSAWTYRGIAFRKGVDKVFRYPDGTVNDWTFVERMTAHVDEDSGHVTHFIFSVIDVGKGQDRGDDNHRSKNVVVPFDGEAFDEDMRKIVEAEKMRKDDR